MSEASGMETGFARVNGAMLFYRAAGHGEPLVMLHAGIADSRMWQPQMAAFAPFYRVIACDLRGFGNSHMPEGHFANYEDLRSLLDHFEIDQAVLIGSSLGGATAMNFTLAYPERARALVLVAPGLGGYEFKHFFTRRQWASINAALAAGNYDHAASLELKMWVAGPRRSLDDLNPQVSQLVRDMLRLMYLNPEDKGIEEPLVPPAIDRLVEIRQPVLLINGELDVSDMRAIGNLLEDTLPHCRRVVIEGAAHLPNLEKPDEFNRLVLDFLSTLE